MNGSSFYEEPRENSKDVLTNFNTSNLQNQWNGCILLIQNKTKTNMENTNTFEFGEFTYTYSTKVLLSSELKPFLMYVQKNNNGDTYIRNILDREVSMAEIETAFKSGAPIPFSLELAKEFSSSNNPTERIDFHEILSYINE